MEEVDQFLGTPITPGTPPIGVNEIAEWFAENAGRASPALHSLLRYSSFHDALDSEEEEPHVFSGFGRGLGATSTSNYGSEKTKDPSLEGASSLHFSLNRLSSSFPSRSQTASCGSPSSDGDNSPPQQFQRMTSITNSRERSKTYAEQQRKESARRRRAARERAGPRGGGKERSLGSTTTHLPKIPGLKEPADPSASAPAAQGGEAFDGDTFTSIGLGLTLETLAEGEAQTPTRISRPDTGTSSAQQSRRSSFARNLITNNRIVANTAPMAGVLTKQDSDWSVDSDVSTPEGKSLLKMKVATPPSSSLDPWMENEAKRENEALIADLEEDLRYKVRNLAVEYDRLQFRELECKEVISTQEATVKLKTKMHKKDLAQREKLLAREASIKAMIRRQEEDRHVVIADRMVYKHILQRVAKLHVETYKKVQLKQKDVEEEVAACKVAKKEQVKIKTEVNAAKIQKFKWLARQEEERKRKNKMINFRRGELRKLKKQSKKMGLVTDSQIISSNFLGLINTVQNAGWEKDNLGDSAEVDKTSNTMMQLHKLYKVTDTANADEVITAWNRSVEGLASLREDRDNKERILEEHEADMLALQEDLELLHLTGKGIFMEKNQEMRHVELQEQLDEEMAELEAKSKTNFRMQMELRVIYQGILNMLKRIKAYGPESMGVLSEHFLATLKHEINVEQAGSMPEEMDPTDVAALYKHFDEALLFLNKLVNQITQSNARIAGMKGEHKETS